MRKQLALVAALGVVGYTSGASAAGHRENFDALSNLPVAPQKAAGFAAAGLASGKQLVRPGSEPHFEPRLGVPTFVWAAPGVGNTALSLSATTSTGSKRTPAMAALEAIGEFAPLYSLSREDAQSTAQLAYIHDLGAGVIVAKFRQQVDGIDVFRTEHDVALDRQLQPVAMTGWLSPRASGASTSVRTSLRGTYQLAPAEAISTALGDLEGIDVPSAAVVDQGASPGAYESFALGARAGLAATDLARVKPVLFDLPSGLVPSYYVEVHVVSPDDGTQDDFAYVLSALDGKILFRNNLTASDAFTYRVWAQTTPRQFPLDGPLGTDPTPYPGNVPGTYIPPFVSPNDITLENTAFSRNDPWLAPGSTETIGNNVEAYVDLFAPDGYSPDAGDFRAQITGPNAFLHTYDVNQQPTSAEQRQAAIQQLFFNINFFHDWYYDVGFDEAAGNAQADNFGRGGVPGDSIKAEGQDYGGRNNANMSTPADGARPRMQMYVFDAVTGHTVTVLAPAAIAGSLANGTAAWGPFSFDLTGDVVYAQPANGCTPLTNAAAVAGKIALIDRGTCPFSAKAQTAQDAGAIGVLIVNNTTGLINMSGSGPTIPSLSLLQTDGANIKTQLANNVAVTVRMFHGGGLDRDGTIDNSVQAHEWGHYISNRLIADASGLTTNMSRGLGEGWADTHAMLIVVRPEDAQNAYNPGWTGAYGLAQYVTGSLAPSGANPNSYWFGIRRVTYSTDLTKNALTFKHIQDGEPLPNSAPILPNGGANSEVHNTGEVWATMLWECYASLLNDPRYTFQQAQDRWRAYLVAAYKLTPPDPTLLEARDALLTAAYATDLTDYNHFGAAFAKRGAGVGAVAPDRYATDNRGVVESYDWNSGLSISATLDDEAFYCDHDGYLDNGEHGNLAVTIRNLRPEPLIATTLAVTSSNSAVSFPKGSTISVPTLQPFESTTLGIEVALSGAAAVDSTTFTFAASDPNLVIAAPASFTMRLNLDELPQTSATDDFEAKALAWTSGHDTSRDEGAPFHLVGTSTSQQIYALDVPANEDQYLISPALNVGTSNFTMSFRHRFDFEIVNTSNGTYILDGAVIELSTDDGATWKDLSALLPAASVPYNGTLTNGSGNALQGRKAFVYRNTAYPNYETVNLNFGTAFQNSTVRVRFRLGTDSGGGALGWFIDDVNFGGITNTPFTTFTGDRAQCVNRPPKAIVGADQTVDERSTATLDASGSSDVDNNPLTYAWTQTGGPSVTLSDATAAKPTFATPEVTADTVLTFQVTVSDGSLTSSATTHVTVKNVNRAPVANAGANQTVDERSTATLDGSASSDPDGDTITYAWTQTAGPTVTLSDATAAKPTFATPEVTADTTLTFSLTVSDGALTNSASTTVTIKNVNRAPVANAGADQIVAERTSVGLDASASSDPDHDGLTFAWVQTGGPTVALLTADLAQPAFIAPEVTADTVLTFQVTVSDGSLTSTATTHVTVQNVNRAPVAKATAPEAALPGAKVTLDASGSSDPDGDVLGYSWEQTAGPTVTLTGATTAKASFTMPANAADGTVFTFKVTVTDEKLTDSATVSVKFDRHAGGANHPPVADAGKGQVVKSGDAVTLDASGSSDADHDELTFTWSQLEGTNVTLSDVHTAKPTFTAPSTEGSLVFQVAVSDGKATSTAKTVVVVQNSTPTTGGGGDHGGGCGCAAGDSSANATLLPMLLGAVLALRIRRRR